MQGKIEGVADVLFSLEADRPEYVAELDGPDREPELATGPEPEEIVIRGDPSSELRNWHRIWKTTQSIPKICASAVCTAVRAGIEAVLRLNIAYPFIAKAPCNWIQFDSRITAGRTLIIAGLPSHALPVLACYDVVGTLHDDPERGVWVEASHRWSTP